MLQQDVPEDFVIATGQTNTLQSFVRTAFEYVGLDWQEHVDIDSSLYRPSEILWNAANPEKAERKLGWKASVCMQEVVKSMIDAAKSTV